MSRAREQGWPWGGCLVLLATLGLIVWNVSVVGPAIIAAGKRCHPLGAVVVFAVDSVQHLICVRPVAP